MADRKEPDHKEDAPEFKVVDRRLFTSEGERRPDVEERPEPSSKDVAPQSGANPSAARAVPSESAFASAPSTAQKKEESGQKSAKQPEPGHSHLRGPVQFEHLVMSLVTTAMFQLGMAARPGERPAPADLPAAQETIDLLSILQQKTKGNLTREEDELLSGSLHELKLAYVELARRTGRVR